MSGSSERSLDRLGAASGAVAIVLLVALLMAFPAPPAADESIATIARDVADSKQSLLVGDYVGLLMDACWLLFGVAVASRQRRADRGGEGWWLVSLAGIAASSAVGFLGSVFDLVFVRAVGHGLAGESLWIGYTGDLVGFVSALPLAVFMLGVGLGNRSFASLPRWTGRLALATVPLLVIGTAAVAGREVDGAPFVFPLMLAYLAMLVWTIAVCVVLWRGSPTAVSPAVPTMA